MDWEARNVVIALALMDVGSGGGGGRGGEGVHSNGSPPCDGGDAELRSRRVITMVMTTMTTMIMMMLLLLLLLLPLPPLLGDSRAGWESSALASVLCGGVRVMARRERENGTAGKPMARTEKETVR